MSGMQREVKIEGELSGCPGCGRQPKHIVSLGKGLHHLECPPCCVRTAKCTTLQEAVELWEANDTIDTRATA